MNTAAQLAFVLLGEAYADLARSLLKIDEEPARELLRSVELRAQRKLDSFHEHDADATSDRELMNHAAQPVLVVLRGSHAAALQG